jgi:hypothetical protein
MRALLFAGLLASGCLRQTQFHCETDDNCGPGGRCQASNFCSFFDASCSGSQQRFGDSAGALANACVDAQGGVDAGVDSAHDSSMMIDARPDTSGDPCPGYATLAGGNPNHKYKLAAADNWDNERTACIASGTTAYLAIPDDAAELAAIATLATGTYWVGIDDITMEGIYQNVKNVSQTFLPWAPSEPDNNGNQDCVAGVSSTQIATELCGESHPGICECEQ